ncbi:unnamed protein product, partial [Rotaria magnacalcarata]
RYLQTFKEEQEQEDDDDNDEELDQFIASTFTPIIEQERIKTRLSSSNKKNLSSIRCFVRQAIDSCRQNLTLVDELIEHIPS